MRRVVLVGVVLGACGREASAPPGAEGALGGVWIGSLARGDQRLPVALWLEEDGERVVGGAAQLEAAPPASTPVAAPAGLPCDELERPALGTIRERVATDLGADVVVVVSLDEDTHALIGEWAADSDAVDEAGAVRLTRVA